MKKLFPLLVLAALIGCKEKQSEKVTALALEPVFKADFTMVFASCSDQERDQPLWKPILENNPDVFIWGGDNVYSDTADMEKMAADYNKVWAHPDYAALAEHTEIIGTWDDHDYGLNDAGVEWEMKDEAQQVFLDFLKISEDDPLRSQKGVYHTKYYKTPKGSIKVILLDTRYYRSGLNKSTIQGRRYEAWDETNNGTVLGEAQWAWLEKELEDETADFNLIVSSIQLLSYEHGWEKWGNFPSEVAKMIDMVTAANAKNILFVSGDRHQAEFSSMYREGFKYPIVDFTSSGMTHVFPNSPTENNEYRVMEVVKELNFGLLEFDFDTKKVQMSIRGEDNKVFQSYIQAYPTED
jgi:alkaline phosphatase D